MSHVPQKHSEHNHSQILSCACAAITDQCVESLFLLRIKAAVLKI